MQFQFRFQAILQIRLAQRDAARRALSHTNGEIERIEQQKRNIEQQIADQHSAQRQERLGKVRVISLERVERRNAFQQRQLAELTNRTHRLRSKLADQTRDLAQSELEVKKLETLRDSELTQHYKELAQHEQREYDDVANARHKPQKRA